MLGNIMNALGREEALLFMQGGALYELLERPTEPTVYGLLGGFVGRQVRHVEVSNGEAGDWSSRFENPGHVDRWYC